MKYESTNIASRIEWCRQQSRQACTPLEAAGWQAEEDGLWDALLNRNHTDQYQHGPICVYGRYVLGLQDGAALLRVSTVLATGMTPMEGRGSARSTTPVRVDRRPSHAPPPVHAESRR